MAADLLKGLPYLVALQWRRRWLHEHRASAKWLDGVPVGVHGHWQRAVGLAQIRRTSRTEYCSTQIQCAHFIPPLDSLGSNTNRLCARKSDGQHGRDKLRHETVSDVRHVAPRANNGLMNRDLSCRIAPGASVGEVWSAVVQPERFKAVATEDLIPFLASSGADRKWTDYIGKRYGAIGRAH